MISIQTNVNSLVAQQNLSVNTAFQSKTIAQLTSGYRINQSGDDAAGLAVANKFRSTVAELTQGVANGNDATAQLQIMDGGMSNISSILDRLKTLATQSASGTFTGNRTTLNSEFQNDLAEIDRQAQSIGLNTNGAFAKNLDVYLGQGSGSSSLQNGVVSLSLTASAVDSQSLGMKGMQAVASGTGVSPIDIGNGSTTTSVQAITNDATNKGSEATPGSTDFYFVGPGFSDSSKVKVSVNLSGVTDAASLVTALNKAITASGGGTSQAGAAFASAGIVASTVTTNGTTQLAFSSSTSAFQVEAGDRMSNALMGNLAVANQPTGAAIQTTVVGGNTGANTDAFAPTSDKTIQIQGAGLSGPETIHFSSTATTVGGAITDLINQVSSNSNLKAAGISVSGTPGGPLTFTSARGESFSVQSTGDSKNQLGLGAFVTNASASNHVDYKSITGSAYNFATSSNDQATLQFSINGAATSAVTVDLTAGDAVKSAATSSAVANPNIVASTASSTVAVSALASHDWSTANETFTVAVNGGSAQSVKLTTNFTLGGNNAALLTEINNQLTGATATIAAGNHLQITANTPGTTGSIVFGGTVANVGGTFNQTAATNGTDMLKFSVDGIGVTAQLSGSSAAQAAGTGALFAAHATQTFTAASSGKSTGSADVTAKDFTGGPVTFQVAVDGGNAQTISLSGNMTDGTAYATAISNQLVGATATYDTTANRLSITSNTTGTSSNIVITDGAGTQGHSAVSGSVSAKDFSAGGPYTFTVDAGDGSGAATVTLNTNITDAQGYANAINGQLTHAHVIVTGASGDEIQFVANATGTTSNITLADTAGAPLGFMNLTAGPGTAGNGPAVATYLHLAAGTAGVAGNNQFLASSDTHGPALVTITAGTYGDNTGTTIQRAVNNALVSAGLLDNAATPTAGIIATLDGSGNLDLTSTTVGAASAVQLTAPPSVYGTTSSALGGGVGPLGIAAGTHVGGSATAASLASQIQSAIDTATGTGSTNAHATATVDKNNKIIITNDTAGASHTISGFSGNSTAWFGTGSAANHTDGVNRTGSSMKDYLNGVFSSDTNLKPAQLQAVWTDGASNTGTLQVVSGNNTNFRVNSGTTGSGVVTGTTDLTAGHNWSGAGEQRFALKVDGAVSADIVLTANASNAAGVLTEVQRAMTAAGVTGVTASLDNGHHLVFTSNSTASTSNIQLVPPAGGTSALSTFGMGTKTANADANIGFGVSGASFGGGLASSAPSNYIIDAGGASSAKNATTGNALTFGALQFGNDAQAITITGNDVDGTQQSRTITLKNLEGDNRAGANIDQAISYINQQLQSSNTATLQKIVAVKENKSGADQINFISSLPAFSVSVASTANANLNDGVNNGASMNVKGQTVGAGSNITIDTQAGAQAAITAITAAVAKLGTAQAAVGKGQNQLTYAISLAQSQITNFSAAESQIRDANVAQQAANLSKAQTLSQASIAAMAQANSAPQAVLSLLRG